MRAGKEKMPKITKGKAEEGVVKRPSRDVRHDPIARHDPPNSAACLL